MAYTFAGHQILAPVRFMSNRDIWTVEKLDKSIDRSESEYQRWELSFGVMNSENIPDLLIELATGNGSPKTMVMPQLNHTVPSGGLPNPTTGKLDVPIAKNIGDSTLQLESQDADDVTLRKGTFIKFANHSKVYMVTSNDVNFTTIGGTQQITIFPSLRAAVSLDTVVEFGDDCVLSYYIDDTSVGGVNFIDGILVGVSNIKVMEAV